MPSNDAKSKACDTANENRYPPHIGALEFYVRAANLEFQILDLIASKRAPPFDALFGIKRSGWVLGTFLSHRLELPLFAKSEIAKIPPKFKHILIVDTVAWTGRSLRRAVTRLNDAGLPVTHAAVVFANPKRNISDDLQLIFGDTCIHVPVFFFNRDFRFSFAHDSDYVTAALDVERERLKRKRID